MKISGVYLITCQLTGKVYVGSSVNIHERWKAHKRMLKGNRHNNIYLQRAWNKYKEEEFSFEILEKTNYLEERENYWINAFDAVLTGFNLSLSAYRQNQQGKNNGMYGKKHSVSAKLKMSACHKGKTLSTEHKQNISKSLTKIKNSRSKLNQKKLKLISPNGEIVEFNGYKECCRTTGINPGGLSHLRRGIRPTMTGWRAYEQTV